MKRQHAFRFVFLTILTAFLIGNFNGTITDGLPVDLPNNVTENSEAHFFYFWIKP
ncbi:hypothetical protein [Piscibacillus salipiscarius]|uniref:hypothetical protein n=1 Tax=Piscibacillus salipiscarius TaxID=299480 RepID=UPI002436F9BA|nr:hypothetical protein [Piscibacillus salipiscarius]